MNTTLTFKQGHNAAQDHECTRINQDVTPKFDSMRFDSKRYRFEYKNRLINVVGVSVKITHDDSYLDKVSDSMRRRLAPGNTALLN